MDNESLSQQLSDAQEEIGRQRHNEAQINELQETSTALESQLNDTLAGFRQIYEKIPVDSYGKISITIANKEPGPNNSDSGGKAVAQIELMQKPEDDYDGKRDWTAWYNPGKNLPDKLAFRIVYVLRTNDGKAAYIGTETSYWQPKDKDTSEYVRSYNHPEGLARPPHYTSDDPEKAIEGYKKYLDARGIQIEDLSKSLKLIKDALENPALNPWYQELLAERERLAKEQEEQVVDAAQSVGAAAVAIETQPEPQVMKRRPRLTRRSRKSHDR